MSLTRASQHEHCCLQTLLPEAATPTASRNKRRQRQSQQRCNAAPMHVPWQYHAQTETTPWAIALDCGASEYEYEAFEGLQRTQALFNVT